MELNKQELWKAMHEPIKTCENCTASIYGICTLAVLEIDGINSTCDGKVEFSDWKYQKDD